MEDEERAGVVDLPAVGGIGAHVGTVHPGLNGAHRVVVPSVRVEFDSGGIEPHQIGSAGRCRAAGEELLLTQGRSARADAEQSAHEANHVLIGTVPVDGPGVRRRCVLGDAVRVVVASLAVSQFVAGEQHRCTGGERQGRQ